MLTVAVLFLIYFNIARRRGKDPVVWGLVGAGMGALSGLTLTELIAASSVSVHMIVYVLLSVLNIAILGLLSFLFIGHEDPNNRGDQSLGNDPRVDELVEAVLDEDINRVRELLDAGVNPVETRQDGYSAVDFARGRSLSEIHELLLEYTAH